jgi:hypothetical protein
MGRLARKHSLGILTGAGDSFVLPPGYYVVGYTTPDDSTQSAESKATIAWANENANAIQVVVSEHSGYATIASIHTTEDTQYPINGQPLYLANATTAQDPITVWRNGIPSNTAQALALVEVSSNKADIAHKAGQESGKLASGAADLAIDTARQSFWPDWLPWVAGGIVVVGGLFAVARIIGK